MLTQGYLCLSLQSALKCNGVVVEKKIIFFLCK